MAEKPKNGTKNKVLYDYPPVEGKLIQKIKEYTPNNTLV
jgi:uncharacterized protein (DUF433 family)